MPGNIYSKDGRWPSKLKNKELEFNILKNVPLKRFGTTSEIAYAVLFLSSEHLLYYWCKFSYRWGSLLNNEITKEKNIIITGGMGF